MIMNFDTTNISGRECYLLLQPSAKHLLIQPVDEHDLRLLEQEVDIIWTLSSEPFSLVAFKIEADYIPILQNVINKSQ